MTPVRNKIFPDGTSAAINRGGLLPWPLIGAALAAMAALYFSADRFVGLPMLAGLLVLSRFTSWRLPKMFILGYGLRAVILAVVLTLMNQTATQDVTVWYLKQADTNLAGYALAADLVLRAWERRDAAAAREGLGVVVLMTAFLFATATNTYERVHIQLIAPIYVVALLLSLRRFAVMQQPAAAKRTMRKSLFALRTVAIALTVGFAGGAVYAVTRYEYQVENYAMQFLRQHRDERHEIGFSASPHLSKVFNPEPSTARLLVIDGQISEPHLRVAAFDTYQNSQWLPVVTDRPFVPISSDSSVATPNAHVLNITRLGDTADLVPVPLSLVEIHCADPLEEDPLGTIRDGRSSSLEPYQVLSALSPTFQGPLSVKPDVKRRPLLLAIPPEIDPKVIALARQVAGSGEPAWQINRLQQYLRSHHSYSLSFDPHGEPLSDFILNDRAAHCQYFASALAIMARAVGIPARYVGGFYAHEPYGGSQTVVRQRDAHAWAECWLDGIGWVTVDATPSGGRPDGIFTDPPAWRRWWEKLNDLPGKIRQWISDNATLLKKFAGVVALLWLGGWAIRRLWILQRTVETNTAEYAGPDAQLVQMAQRYERWLKDRGIPCPPESTWRSHLRSQLVAHPDGRSNPLAALRDDFHQCDRFVEAYDRARFGADGDSAARAGTLLTQIERDK